MKPKLETWDVFVESDDDDRIFIVTFGDKVIAEIPEYTDKKEAKSLAKLIALTPEILNALIETTEQLGLYLLSIEDGKDTDAERAYRLGRKIIKKTMKK